MNEIRAVLDAAYIQGVCAIIAALIGAYVIVKSIVEQAKNTLISHKVDKLTEAKRDVYLDLVQDWQSFLMDLSSYQSIELKENYLVKFQESLSKVLGSLHKASFISDPLTKEKILDFTMDLSKANFKFIEYIERWYALGGSSNERPQVVLDFMEYVEPIGLNAMNLQITLRDELGLKEDDDVNQRILKKQKDFSKEIRNRLRSRLGIQ
ncbi:hypothetical protein NDN13_01285 [Acinetobacter sp. C32I]|uniref:hypothetical protein n=1 Tax=Acinetobacter sp. C32I TaxID=2950074 RepID=UPI00203729B4|nr:hypothetical protein [Acinetobacter sp. C32I]USA53853.1 hypothetical protein NDN13_01285 [Acinetobacter sp. C32I]